MPARTNTDLIRELTVDLAANKQLDAFQHDQFRKEIDELKTAVEKVLNGVQEILSRVSVIEQRCTHLEKQFADADHRRWQLLIGVLTCFFTGVIALIVALIKK